MTTLNGQPEVASRSAPLAPPLDPTKPDTGETAAAARPTAPAEILPMLVESPAWPRVFPSL